MQEYAVYKGDELLGVGTLTELANQLGVKRRTIMCYGTPSHKVRSKGKGRILIKLDDEE